MTVQIVLVLIGMEFIVLFAWLLVSYLSMRADVTAIRQNIEAGLKASKTIKRHTTKQKR